MPPRSSRLAFLLVVACLGCAAARADEASDIEKLYLAGDVEQAMQLADAAIAKQPRAAQVRFLKGVMLADLKREAEATHTFVALTEDFPELPDPFNNLAVLYAGSGQLQSALIALQAALRNDPKHRAARENLGDVYLALAMQAWAASQTTSKGDDAELRRKLRLAREIQAVPPRPTAARPPG
ncbi:MAG: tetratricopeptide repeat protein [Rubrivivax sp.]